MAPKALIEEFQKEFKADPGYVFFAPGRVNLIGEHIDYNGGTVLPVAISVGTYLLVGKNNKNTFDFHSLNFDDYAEVLMSSHYRSVNVNWVNYPLGVISQFNDKVADISGLNMLFSGNIPLGSGLSSSASIEMVTAFALNHIFGSGISTLDLIQMAKTAENEFIGLNSGIMDQYAISFGQKDIALALDCQKRQHDNIPCNLGEYNLVVINTNKSRSLADSKYNERYAQCRQALAVLQHETDVNELCELSPKQFDGLKHLIADPTLLRRAQHVIEENHRVHQAVSALKKGEIENFGHLMYDSHLSLKQLFDVTGRELDTVVEISQQQEGVIGARMTGAGFGGCAIALVHKSNYKTYVRKLGKEYKQLIGYEPNIFRVKITNGVHKVA